MDEPGAACLREIKERWNRSAGEVILLTTDIGCARLYLSRRDVGIDHDQSGEVHRRGSSVAASISPCESQEQLRVIALTG